MGNLTGSFLASAFMILLPEILRFVGMPNTSPPICAKSTAHASLGDDERKKWSGTVLRKNEESELEFQREGYRTNQEMRTELNCVVWGWSGSWSDLPICALWIFQS